MQDRRKTDRLKGPSVCPSVIPWSVCKDGHSAYLIILAYRQDLANGQDLTKGIVKCLLSLTEATPIPKYVTAKMSVTLDWPWSSMIWGILINNCIHINIDKSRAVHVSDR